MLEAVARALRMADSVVVLTGAGISRESGLPTFRDPVEGLWAHVDPHDICTPEAFAADPRLVWEWHESQRELVERARPNAGHLALAALERHMPRVTIATQNFDGLHQEAGSARVLELHGSVRRLKCSREGEYVAREEAGPGMPPTCRRCGAPLRHDVVWFGEPLPDDAWSEAVARADACDVLLSVGTSGMVQPAAWLPEIAMAAGATVLFVNLDVEDGADPPIYAVNGRAGDVLPDLLRRAWGHEP